MTAVKFTVVDQPVPIDSLLKDCIGETQMVHVETKTIFGITELISNYICCNKHLNEKNLVCSPEHYPIQPPGGDRHFKLYFPDKDVVAMLSCLSGDFLKTLQDEDINVRRAALVMFNSAAHNKPSLIRGLLATVLPYLYKETQIRKELIREVSFKV